MYLAGILVATLSVFVYADVVRSHDTGAQGPEAQGTGSQDQAKESSEHTQSTTSLTPLQNDPPIKMSEFCFFARYPSATCRFRCHLMRMEAYCMESEGEQNQSGEGKCKCRPEASAPSQEAPQEIFARPETHKEQEAEKKPEEGQPPQPSFAIHMQTAPQVPEEDQQKQHVVFYIFDLNKIFGPQANETKPEAEVPQEGGVPGGWSYQYLAALLIILLLMMLISLEVYACYKKTRGKRTDMETIFKNIPMPDKA